MERTFIGQFNRRITLSYNDETTSSTGAVNNVLVEIGVVSAKYMDKSGTMEQEEKLLHTNTRDYLIRYRKDVWAQRNELTITDNGVNYRVYHTAEMDRNKFLKLTATVYE
jgi:head-tail adaptor